jgi:hypothetical protein
MKMIMFDSKKKKYLPTFLVGKYPKYLPTRRVFTHGTSVSTTNPRASPHHPRAQK